jgi:hypothetical protein
MAAITELEELINKTNPNILGRNQSWFKTWRKYLKATSLLPAKQTACCNKKSTPSPNASPPPSRTGAR